MRPIEQIEAANMGLQDAIELLYEARVAAQTFDPKLEKMIVAAEQATEDAQDYLDARTECDSEGRRIDNGE